MHVCSVNQILNIPQKGRSYFVDSTSLSPDNILFPYGPNEILNGHVPIRNIPVMAGVTKHDGSIMTAGKPKALKSVFRCFLLLSRFRLKTVMLFKFNDEFDLENNQTFNTYDLIRMTAKQLGISSC